MKIRIGNDFQVAWMIKENGVAVDLSTVTDLEITAKHSRIRITIEPYFKISNGIAIINFTKEDIKQIGIYYLLATYRIPDANFEDGYRDVTADIDSFEIVSRTDQEKDITNQITSEVAIGFKGDKGDPFLYEDFTLEQINELQRPATDAAMAVNEAEALRVTAETTRFENEQGRVTAEQTRQTNTATAITNANIATGLANDAATLANTKAGLANDAATLANTKAGLANDAATLANNAAEAVAPSVINNEEVQAEVYNLLNARISALESIIAAGVYNYIQADTLIGVNSLQYKGAELILTGTAAPAIVPDFIGQIYVNTTGGVTYMAKGVASAADWKQTSN